MDPDYVPNGTAFAVKWSPWVSSGDSRVASLAFIANNYVGFRRITIEDDWKRGKEPRIAVEDSDTTSICLSLSTDAFVEWEDTVCPTLNPMRHSLLTRADLG